MTIRRTPREPVPVNNPEELWLPVVGYEDLYLVSSLGRVYSIISSKFLKPRVSTKGYHRAALTKNGRREEFQTHNIVASAFIGPCPEGMEVNHENGIKSDNRPGNFKYVIHRQNVQHAWDTGLRINRRGYHKLNIDQVVVIRREYRRLLADRLAVGKRRIRRGDLKLIAERFGVASSHIHSIGVGKSWNQSDIPAS